jgi:hypothetical protein
MINIMQCNERKEINFKKISKINVYEGNNKNNE